jgi:hypothetical protein
MDFSDFKSNPMAKLLGQTDTDIADAGYGRKQLQVSGDLSKKIQNVNSDDWNKQYPYLFRVYRENGVGRSKESLDGIGQNGIQSLSEVLLNLPPQAISISTHFASSVLATNNGILEENNGVVFRTISITGTTGILPERRNVIEKPKEGALSVVTDIFASTTQAIGNTLKTAARIFNSGKEADKLKDSEYEKTGYYQFWLLHHFLVAYAEQKKKKKQHDLRLAFISRKDNVGYYVTPVSFDMKRDASSPLVYRYSIMLKAWEIIPATGIDPIEDKAGLDTRDPSYVGFALDSLRKTRGFFEQYNNIVRGVQSDIANITDIVGQSILLIKDFLGIAKTLADFPGVVKNNWDRMITDNSKAIEDVISSFDSNPGSEPVPKIENKAALSDSTSQIAKTTLGNALLSSSEVKDAIQIDALTLSPAVQEQIQQEEEKAQALTSGQVRDLAQKMQDISDNLAKSTGSMDATYAALYGVQTNSAAATRTLTEDSIILSAQIQDSKNAIHSTLASGLLFNNKDINPFTDANNAVAPEDAMEQPLSGVPVFVDRGMSLEDIAFRYFKDVKKAREIALTNGLRAPYIDEAGFDLSIQSPSGRSFFVDSVSNLVIGQKISIQGASVARTIRNIVNIDKVGDSYRITVDGNDNLDAYNGGNPYLHTRLPGTVGSGDTILIPSTLATNDIQDTPNTPLLSRLSHAERVFKIDMSLDKDGDIVIDPVGDAQRSYGYKNAVQALRLLLNTERGEQRQHPLYGMPAFIGEKNNELSPEQVVEIIKKSVVSDPRFSDAVVDAKVEGSVVRIKIDAKGASSTGTVALEFEVNV